MKIYKILFLILLFGFGPVASEAQNVLSHTAGDSIAIIVCPGGSYCWLSRKTEGSEVASWLQENGYAAYTLYYPTAGWAAFFFHTRALFGGHQYPDQLDAFRTMMRQVRAKGYKKVGAIGFSAGGHLVLNAAEDPEMQREGIAPYFIAPIYPVVTMSHPCVHHRSRRGLLGEYKWHNKVMQDSLSMEKHADRIHCPVFMINCEDDPIVPKHNAELMDSALNVYKVPHYYKQYKRGGHGFGTDESKTTAETITWKENFLKWMKENGEF